MEEHRRLRQRGDFLIFPQLQLRWNPRNPRDLRSNLPDLGLGHLIPPDGRLYIQGGAEHKRTLASYVWPPSPCNCSQKLRGP